MQGRASGMEQLLVWNGWTSLDSAFTSVSVCVHGINDTPDAARLDWLTCQSKNQWATLREAKIIMAMAMKATIASQCGYNFGKNHGTI
eukprot:364001-Chlamydomonas_euryale.AAC.18